MYTIQELKKIHDDIRPYSAKLGGVCAQLIEQYKRLVYIRNNLYHFRQKYMDKAVHNNSCNCYICSQISGINSTLARVGEKVIQ